MLSKLPDLERFIAKFGMLSFGMRPADHPDKRAVLYEDILYNRQKTQKFCYVLESFQNINEWKKSIQSAHDIDEKLKKRNCWWYPRYDRTFGILGRKLRHCQG